MSDQQEVGTKTVRIASEAARQLQTISALTEQMGGRFRAVEFLNSLVEKPIAELYEATVRDFAEFTSKKQSKRKPKS